jgi:hypothetical protein
MKRISDRTVRANVLISTLKLLENRADHRDFILDIIAKSEDNQLIKDAIRILARVFRDDPVCFSILLKQADEGSRDIRLEALRGILISKQRAHKQGAVQNLLLEEPDSDIRRQCVKTAANELKVSAFVQIERGKFFDYAVPFDFKFACSLIKFDVSKAINKNERKNKEPAWVKHRQRREEIEIAKREKMGEFRKLHKNIEDILSGPYSDQIGPALLAIERLKGFGIPFTVIRT